MKRKPLTLFELSKIDTLSTLARRLPPEVVATTPYLTIRLLRQRLGLSQSQIAKRVGTTQTHIGRIERGETDIQWSTLVRVLGALESQAVLLARPRASWHEIIRPRAEAKAAKNLSHMMGSMGLEKQRPPSSFARQLYQKEVDRLIQSPSPSLWDD